MDEYTDNVTAPPPSWARRILSVLLILIVLGAGVGTAVWLIRNRPQAKRRRPPKMSTLVETIPAQSRIATVTVEGMGTVVPATTISLAPRVGGEIEWVSPQFVPGGRFDAGEVILRLDRTDYELLVQQREAALEQRLAEQRQAASAVKQREADIARAEAQVQQAETDILNAQAGIESAQAQVEQREGEVIRTRSALRLEKGQQAVAREEYELLGETLENVDRELVLREPQLASAEAELRAAEANKRAAEAQKRAAETRKLATEANKVAAERALDAARVARESAIAAQGSAAAAVAAARTQLAEAKLDLGRTAVVAPFPVVVRERLANLGSQVNAGSPVATLVGTDAYWVEVNVPVDRLRWLNVPGFTDGEPSFAVLTDANAWAPGAERRGRVLGLRTDLETSGRLARLLVTVPDPLALEDAGEPPLILGSYLQVRLEGRPLPDVIAVPRDAVHDGQTVWVMDEQKTLDIRAVRIAWTDSGAVYVSEGLAAGEHIVVSDIGTPVEGLLLRRRGDPLPAPPRESDPRQAGETPKAQEG